MSFGAYKQNLTKPEFYKEYNKIQEKLDLKQELTSPEKRFFISALPFDKLLLYPFCFDEYFCRIYLNIAFQPITEKDVDYYKGFLREWKNMVETIKHDEELLHFIANETREELKVLKKKYSFLHPLSTTKDYLDRRTKILEWSKYKYITIKYIFEETVQGNKYKLYLSNKEIIYDYFSLSHILTRHYGHIMKPYEVSKSHVTDIEFDPEMLHLKIQNIFQAIDKSGLYKNNTIEEINIRYNGIIYKIYCQHETSVKDEGKSSAVKFLRLNTFFPVTHKSMLNRLSTQFEEKEIDSKLSVFVKPPLAQE
jgi:hypothetical protein